MSVKLETIYVQANSAARNPEDRLLGNCVKKALAGLKIAGTVVNLGSQLNPEGSGNALLLVPVEVAEKSGK